MKPGDPLHCVACATPVGRYVPGRKTRVSCCDFCKEHDPGRHGARDAVMFELRRGGLTDAQIAELYSLTRQAVSKILNRAR